MDERSLIRVVGLREAQRHVQGERELEEHECALLALTTAIEQGQQFPVVRDRLVEGVVLARLVARDREVPHGLVLVFGPEPVVGEQAGDVGFPAGVVLLQPCGRPSMERWIDRPRRACGRPSPGSGRA